MATLPVTELEPVAVRSAVPARRWLHVVSHTDPRYGGLSSAVPSLAASLSSREGLQVPLAAFCVPGEEYRPAPMRGEDVLFWPTSRIGWMRDRKLSITFAQAIDEADGLHIHGLWEQSTMVACRLARQKSKPYVLSAHGMLEPWALATKRLKKRVYAALTERANVAGAACLHALTAAEAEQYRNFGANGPIAIVPNAVELPEGAHPDLFLAHFPELRGKRVLLFLSRLHPKKGLDLLMEAWARSSKGHADAHLVIAGPDEDGMQSKLMAQAAGLGVEDRVTFAGMLTGSMKWSALATARCYVLPSYSEGLSMALLEAMGMGLPVIATRACNMPEITSVDAGWEIEANVEALASAVGDFLNGCCEENESKGRNGASLIAARYTPARVARQMAEVYEYVLSGRLPEAAVIQMGGTR